MITDHADMKVQDPQPTWQHLVELV